MGHHLLPGCCISGPQWQRPGDHYEAKKKKRGINMCTSNVSRMDLPGPPSPCPNQLDTRWGGSWHFGVTPAMGSFHPKVDQPCALCLAVCKDCALASSGLSGRPQGCFSGAGEEWQRGVLSPRSDWVPPLFPMEIWYKGCKRTGQGNQHLHRVLLCPSLSCQNPGLGTSDGVQGRVQAGVRV